MLSKRPDTIVTFGDSLSDAGTIFGLTDQLLTVPIPLSAPPVNGPGYAGVWSDGPVYTQIFPGLLGADHYGYAVGSAEAMRDETLESVLDVAAGFIDPTIDPALSETLLDFDIGFDAQVERFVDGDPRFPNAPALALNDADTVAATVFIGLNDIGTFSLDANFDNPTIFLFQALAFINRLEQAIKDDVQTLVDSGKIDQLVVIAPPSLTFFPGGDDASDEEQDGADLFQETLADRLSGIVEDINDDGDVEALHLDLDPLMDEIMADGVTFGLTAVGPIYSDTQDPVIGPVNPATGLPDVTYELNADVADLPLSQIRFTDELHFSGATQGMVAAFTATALTHDLEVLGSGDDSDAGTRRADLVFAGDGDDTFDLGRGDDVVLLGEGDDAVDGGNGRDLMSGGSGSDNLNGGRGKDLIAGGLGNDLGHGGAGRDLLLTGQGDDILRGGAGRDTFVYVDPEETGIGSAGATVLRGGAGSDTVVVLTDPATAKALRTEMAAMDAEDLEAGRYDFEALDLSLRGVETVEVRGRGIDALDRVEAPDADLLTQADLWGFI